MKNILFSCAIFIDDGNDLDTIIEDKVSARDESEACSLLLSKEAHKRNIPYYWLKEKVRSALVKIYEY